jgi:hypothetical protein
VRENIMVARLRLISSAPSRNSNGKDYTVGYKKPPRHSRFRPGQSGNPSGRKKGVRNLASDVKRTLKVPVKVHEGGRSRKVSTQAGILMVLREKALKGDARALDRLLELAMRFDSEPAPEAAHPLSTDDQAILDAYRNEIAASLATNPPQPKGIKPRPLTRMRSAQ